LHVVPRISSPGQSSIEGRAAAFAVVVVVVVIEIVNSPAPEVRRRDASPLSDVTAPLMLGPAQDLMMIPSFAPYWSRFLYGDDGSEAARRIRVLELRHRFVVSSDHVAGLMGYWILMILLGRKMEKCIAAAMLVAVQLVEVL
jgi:hypothetical protein